MVTLKRIPKEMCTMAPTPGAELWDIIPILNSPLLNLVCGGELVKGLEGVVWVGDFLIFLWQ